jgi:hypothetical protein
MEVVESRQFVPAVDVSLSDDLHLNAELYVATRSAIDEFGTSFSVSPPAGIRPVSILYRSRGPLTDSTSDTTRYKVYLSVKNDNYRQLVFQLGHELCHIFTNPRRTNWFVESCCEMAALVLLHSMSRLWGSNPPRDNWRSYAPKFQQYAQDRILRVRQTEQPDYRQRCVIVAEMLYPLFQESRESWDALSFLGQASTSPPVSLTDWNPNTGFTFDRWLQAVPEHLKSIVARICEAFKDRWHEFDCSHPVMPL